MRKRLINYDEYKGYVNDICVQLHRSNWRPDYIVGISRGGLLPAVMISQMLDVPMKPLQVSLREHIECVSDLGMAEDAFGAVPLEDQKVIGSRWDISYQKNILIVDDINDQGSTINWILNDWPSGCHPSSERWNNVWNKNVKFAVIVDNLASKCNVKMDYVGCEVNKAEDDLWIVFPYEEWWK